MLSTQPSLYHVSLRAYWLVFNLIFLRPATMQLTVDLIIPAPFIQVRRLGVRSNPARPILLEQAHERRATRPSIQPNRQRSIDGIFARLKEPEKPVFNPRSKPWSASRSLQLQSLHGTNTSKSTQRWGGMVRTY